MHKFAAEQIAAILILSSAGRENVGRRIRPPTSNKGRPVVSNAAKCQPQSKGFMMIWVAGEPLSRDLADRINLFWPKLRTVGDASV
jgi:hypothetical protein